MRFNRRNCSSDSKIFGITRAVAGKYTECLNNSGTFSMKLQRLVVLPFDVPVQHVFAQTFNNQTESKVMVVYDETMSDKLLAFTIAHEFAHILFYPQGDKLRFFQGKKIVRYQEKGVECLKEYRPLLDKDLEEAMANHAAWFIVSKLNYEDKEDQLKSFLEQETHVGRHELITGTETAFGKRLMECEKIDEYEVAENEIIIANSLWYNAVTHFLY